jgi:hypothetical protein
LGKVDFENFKNILFPETDILEMEEWIKLHEKRVFLQVQKVMLELNLSLKVDQKQHDKSMTMEEKLKVEKEVTEIQQKMIDVTSIIHRNSLLSAVILADVEECNRYDRREAEFLVHNKVVKLFDIRQ